MSSKDKGPVTVEVSEIKATAFSYGGMEITGILKSKCSVSLRNLRVRFSIYDPKDNIIDIAEAYLPDLGPEQTWKFEAISGKSGSYRMDGATFNNGWVANGALYVKNVDQERRQEREQKQAVEREKQKAAKENRPKPQQSPEAQQDTFKYYLKLAFNGNGFGQLKIGKFYLDGYGTETNLEQARFWLLCASTNGQADAEEYLRGIPKQ